MIKGFKHTAHDNLFFDPMDAVATLYPCQDENPLSLSLVTLA